MGISEQTLAEVRELRREVGALLSMIGNSKASQKDWMKVSDLAKKHGVSPQTIDRMLFTMSEKGYNVAIMQRSKRGARLVNVEQFDRAFRDLFAKEREVA